MQEQTTHIEDPGRPLKEIFAYIWVPMVYLSPALDGHCVKSYNEMTHVDAEKIVIITTLFVNILRPALVALADDAVYSLRFGPIIPVQA